MFENEKQLVLNLRINKVQQYIINAIQRLSVEARLLPLTPKHGFPSLFYKAKDAPQLPVRFNYKYKYKI